MTPWEDWHEVIQSHIGKQLESESWIVDYNVYMTSIAAIVVWVGFWYLRRHDDPTRWSDLRLLVAFHAFSAVRSSSIISITPLLLKAGFAISITTVVSLVALTIAGIARFPKSGKPQNWKAIDCVTPLLLRCRTTHSRFFPKTHSFSYSYLQVSVPVGFDQRIGRVLSVGPGHRWSVFHVNPLDYLRRQCSSSTLEDRLDDYLQSQGISKDEWRRAYLVTAPRFLGYSFNPVSFWYLYDDSNQLTMMILEVNNTFDERRMYLLKNDWVDDMSGESPGKFKQQWQKDFHVSPFSSRKGGYSLSAIDAFQSGQLKFPGIDNTITLTSSKKHSKLVARLHSEDAPLRADTITTSQLLGLSMFWGWKGFFTSPRILKEAFLLYFRRKLHVWLRPEVTSESIGRTATELERSLESFLASYLKHKADNCTEAISVQYASGLHPASAFPTCIDSHNQVLEIQVLSPEFFSRLTHYGTLETALYQEGVVASEKCQTVRISSRKLLQSLLGEECTSKHLHTKLHWLKRLQWNVVKYLRHPPTAMAYSKHDNAPLTLQEPEFSSLDQFVSAKCEDAWRYRRILTRLFLARRVSFGIVGLIDLLDLSVRILLIATAHSSVAAQCGVYAWAVMKG